MPSLSVYHVFLVGFCNLLSPEKKCGKHTRNSMHSYEISQNWLISFPVHIGVSTTALIPQKHLVMCVCSVVQSCPTLCNPTRLFCPCDSPGMNTGVGCHALLQGIFLTQGLNSHLLYLLHCQVAVVVKNLPAKARDLRDVSSVPGSGRSPGGGHGNPL